MRLSFAMGKVYEDLGDPDELFRQGSSDAWREFEAYLQPLIKGLVDS